MPDQTPPDTINPPLPDPGPVLRIADLSRARGHAVSVAPDAETRAAIARALEIDALKKLRFEGRLEPEGKADWRLEGRLGATVVQPCVVTFAPVTTRIDEPLARVWRADWAEPEAEEMELPDNVDEEPLGAEIDIGGAVVEALALALPAFPRAKDAELGEAVFTEPGKQAMRDEDTRPFAGLAGLRDKLEGGSE